MNKFKGKVLLELGSNVGSVDIVKYAKSEGAYVIVADYLPKEKSEAKKYADEISMISTLDIEGIYELAKTKHVDGIFCGVNEHNLNTVYEVSKRLGLYCYFTREQSRLNQDKLYFKKKCSEYGMLTPKIYTISDTGDSSVDDIVYPVIVKPNDESSGIGVSICNNPDELREKMKEARKLSSSGIAFAEEYIEGEEISIDYTIINGKARLSCIKDKLLSKDHSNITSLSDILLVPSKHTHDYMLSTNEKVINFLENELYSNGAAFLQGIYKNGEIYFIEMGCRMSGGSDWKIVEKENGINFLHMMVDYSLLGNVDDYNLSAENPLFNHISGRYSIIAHKGKIGKIDGLDAIRKIKGVIDIDCRRQEGDIIEENGSLRQEVLTIHIFVNNYDEFARVIEDVQKNIVVLDEFGNNMLFKNFDIGRLK